MVEQRSIFEPSSVYEAQETYFVGKLPDSDIDSAAFASTGIIYGFSSLQFHILNSYLKRRIEAIRNGFEENITIYSGKSKQRLGNRGMSMHFTEPIEITFRRMEFLQYFLDRATEQQWHIANSAEKAQLFLSNPLHYRGKRK